MYLVSRTETFAKLFFIVSFTGLFMYVALAFYSFHTAYSTVSQISGDHNRVSRLRDLAIERFTRDLKYILVWEVRNDSIMEEGQTPFINYDCSDINCYITANRTILNSNYTNFDAIVFDFSVTRNWYSRLLPLYRSPHQKFVFYSKMPSEKFPVCSVLVNNYFNWTWTYKFNSDIFNPLIEVKDLDGNVVAPSTNIVWKKNTPAITDSTNNIDEVNTKTKALIWVMKNCERRISSSISIRRLQRALKEHSLVFDIYGCGNLECPNDGCLEIIERDYYFYLAYEHSIAVDYVTDKVLDAYQHDAVPIVIGGADYAKFLPTKSYINFQDFSEDTLAALIAYTLRTPSKYREYFYWKKHYTISKAAEGRGFCQLCTLLNDKKKFNSYSTYNNFRQWWYQGSLKKVCIPKGAEKYTEVQSFMNITKKT